MNLSKPKNIGTQIFRAYNYLKKKKIEFKHKILKIKLSLKEKHFLLLFCFACSSANRKQSKF